MAFSNTVSTTVFSTAKVVESAVRRCKVPAEQITAETWEIASNQLYLFLSDLSNQGAPLWCIEKQLYPLQDGVGALVLDAGTNDVENSFFRTMSPVTGTNTDTATSRTIEFEAETVVTTVGVLWSASAVPIAFERSDDGIVWTTVQTETPTASAGQLTWFDLNAAVATKWFRISATSGTLGFSAITTANNPLEIPLARMNRDDWTSLPNKFFKSDRVLQFWFDRQIPRPIMRLWPLPNAAAEAAVIVVWRQRYIMDVGSLTQELNVPQRWYEAVVSGLAAKLCRELIEADSSRIPLLDADAAKALYTAQQEERDDSPIHWAPNIAMYTA